MQDPLSLLPFENLIDIIEFFSTKKSDVLSLSLINKHMYEFVSENEMLYRRLSSREQTIPIGSRLYTYYRNIYYEYEKLGSPKSEWFLRYSFNQLKWVCNDDALALLKSIASEVCIVSFLDMAGNEKSKECINHIVGISDAFTAQNQRLSKDEACLKQRERSRNFFPNLEVYMKPFVYKSKKSSQKTNVIFLKANGLFNSGVFQKEKELRKSLMSFLMIYSSTIVLIKNDNEEWVKKMDEIVSVHEDFRVIGSGEMDLRSLFVINIPNESSDPEMNNKAFDVINCLRKKKKTSIKRLSFSSFIGSDEKKTKVQEKRRKLENLPFISCLINWFGKIHGYQFNPSNKFSEMEERRMDLWRILYHLVKPLTFGWQLDSKTKSTGALIGSFIEECVKYANLEETINTAEYRELSRLFGKKTLQFEVMSAERFYSRVMSEEIRWHKPLEMDELVKISEMHAAAALKIFTEQIKDLIFPYNFIRHFETMLKGGINMRFRGFWQINGQNSESYSEKIFDSCFKWITSQIELRSEEDSFSTISNFSKKFYESVELYLLNSKGTRKYSVLSFCSGKILNLVRNNFPELSEVCNKLIESVEKTTIKNTLEVDRKRSFLQKKGGYKLKLLTIENSIIRLKEEIKKRNILNQKGEEWNTIILDRYSRLGIEIDKTRNFFRNEFELIQACSEAIKIEEIERKKLKKTLEEFEKKKKKFLEGKIIKFN